MDKIREHENLRGCAEGILIRTEEPGDFDIVRELVRLSFKDMEESDHTEHLLVDRIRRSDAYIPALSLVAEVPGAGVVGHVMLSKVEVVSEKGSVALPGVAPLSVLPCFSGIRTITRDSATGEPPFSVSDSRSTPLTSVAWPWNSVPEALTACMGKSVIRPCSSNEPPCFRPLYLSLCSSICLQAFKDFLQDCLCGYHPVGSLWNDD